MLSIMLLLAAQTAPAPPLAETITVTAARTGTRLGETPASVVVMTRQEIESSPAATIDDTLRQVTGFTLFRRAGSRVANPTTQGVTLRGIGASGASRALLLDDGVPLHDPFGGWIHWGRINPLSLERVEVIRGGASELYGSGAMGGVVQFIRRQDAHLAADLSAGSQSTLDAAAHLARNRGAWRASLGALHFDTAGWIPVSPEQRGAVDRRADSRHTSLEGALHRHAAFVRMAHYQEVRNNGTPLQVNDTSLWQLSGGGEWRLMRATMLARAWLGEQSYHQTFSAISADRSTERLTNEQTIDAQSAGASAQWSGPLGNAQLLLLGAEWKRVASGADQQTSALFIEDLIAIGTAASATAGLRFDRWDGGQAWSPRLAAIYRFSNRFSLTGSAYQAFRAPTLNELYRDFRAGNVITLANDALQAERVRGLEAGARGQNVRATLFWMELRSLISNVTVSATPSLITRQRRNVASGRSRGVEIDGQWWPLRSMQLSAGYLWADSTFAGGERIPQVPRHQLTAQARWNGPFTVALLGRWSTMQFDDDLNRFPLAGFSQFDLFLALPLHPLWEVTLSAENLLDERIETATTPVISYAQPRAVRAGLRFRSPRR